MGPYTSSLSMELYSLYKWPYKHGVTEVISPISGVISSSW